MKPSRVRPAGFTLTELMVVVLIIAALAGISYPVGKALIARSRSTACIARLRDIGVALESYLQDNAQTMPNIAAGRKSKGEEVAVLDTELRPYLSNPESFHCPADHELFEHSGCSYIWNSTQSGRNRNSLAFFGKSGADKRIPLVTDKEEWHPGEPGVNFLYADLSASNKLRFGINR
jgi:prepilin-type N-terminal cleavage/methylation domain-containing protein